MSTSDSVSKLLRSSSVHDEWRPLLGQALGEMEQDYLDRLIVDGTWLPGRERLLGAFRRDRGNCHYILFGESPYPRAESANGIAFHDASVSGLWSPNGLSKAVNRATSLRNIIKTALLAEGHLQPAADGRITQASIAAIDKSHLIQTLDDFFTNLQRRGFLMLNATPVLHPQRKPLQESRAWQGFNARLLALIADHSETRPTLVLWGKIAASVTAMDAARKFPQLVCEHPYNLGFIHNPVMQELFAQLRLLRQG